MQPSYNRVPLFEETCRLLYRTHPDELLTFVTFTQLARDYQALEDSAFARKCRKEFFYHRALLALPAIVSSSLTPVLPEAIRVHSKLLLYRYLIVSCFRMMFFNFICAVVIQMLRWCLFSYFCPIACGRMLLLWWSRQNTRFGLTTHTDEIVCIRVFSYTYRVTTVLSFTASYYIW